MLTVLTITETTAFQNDGLDRAYSTPHDTLIDERHLAPRRMVSPTLFGPETRCRQPVGLICTVLRVVIITCVLRFTLTSPCNPIYPSHLPLSSTHVGLESLILTPVSAPMSRPPAKSEGCCSHVSHRSSLLSVAMLTKFPGGPGVPYNPGSVKTPLLQVAVTASCSGGRRPWVNTLHVAQVGIRNKPPVSPACKREYGDMTLLAVGCVWNFITGRRFEKILPCIFDLGTTLAAAGHDALRGLRLSVQFLAACWWVSLYAVLNLILPSRMHHKQRAKTLVKLVPLAMLLGGGAMRHAPTSPKILLQAGQWNSFLCPHTHGLQESNLVVQLPVQETQSMQEFTAGGEKEPPHIRAPSAAALAGPRAVTECLLKNVVARVKHAKSSFLPTLMLGAYAAEATKGQGGFLEASVTGPSAWTSSETPALSLREEATIVGRAAPVGQGPDRTSACPRERTVRETDSKQKNGKRSSYNKVAWPYASPECLNPQTHPNNSGSSGYESIVEQVLRHGTEEERIQAVLELSRMHVPSWEHLSIEQLDAQRITGGLTNRLYVVKVRECVAEQPQIASDAIADPSTSGKEGKSNREDKQLGKYLDSYAEEEEKQENTPESKERRHGNEELGADKNVTTVASTNDAAILRKGSAYPQKVLFRVFGNPDSLPLFDPQRERVIFRSLSNAGLAPTCYAAFSNGRIEGWIEGAPLLTEDLHVPHIQDMIVTALSKFHDSSVKHERLLCSQQLRCFCNWRDVLPSESFVDTSSYTKKKSRRVSSLHPQTPHLPKHQAGVGYDLHHPRTEQTKHSPLGKHTHLQGASTTSHVVTTPHVVTAPHVVTPPHAVTPLPEVSRPSLSPSQSLLIHSTTVAAHQHQTLDTVACTCSLCRGRDWELLAQAAGRHMLSALARAEAVAISAGPSPLSEGKVCSDSNTFRRDAAGHTHVAQRNQYAPYQVFQPPFFEGQVVHHRGAVEINGPAMFEDHLILLTKNQQYQKPSGDDEDGDSNEGVDDAGTNEAASKTFRSKSEDGGASEEDDCTRSSREKERKTLSSPAECSQRKSATTAAAAAAHAQQIRNTLHALRLLNLDKYRAELAFFQQAVRMQILRELAPGELERVYGSVNMWRLLSGGSPVMSHNDFQENNIMRTATGVHLIDFEYAGENLRAADLGNLFCEMTIDYVSLQDPPYFTLDPSKFPSLSARRDIIFKYLRAVVLQHLEKKEKQPVAGVALKTEEERETIVASLVTEDVITNFEAMTRLFVLGSHLLWSFWSVVKSPLSQPADEFNYLEYGRRRLEMYDKQKKEFFPSDLTS